MGAATQLKPVRVCRCGRVMAGRAPNAKQCLDCAAGKVPDQSRQRPAFSWLHGQHRTVNV